ncbi:FecR family protein [Sphingomonas asaccharolytica]|uniref:FecR family protein n=1 Tax=Sphingomonas asaccharolytica TaxID=40681 RepID=UPI000834C676|nr:FecR domain-containing protein [Sphingomonas asaccharolytica]
MSNRDDPRADRDRIREQAAAWLARMERGTSPRAQRDLDHWLAADPRHADSYRRLAAQFDGARQLRVSRRFVDRPPPRRRSPAVMAAAACLLAAILLLAFLFGHRATLPARREPGAVASVAAGQPPAVLRVEAPAAAIRSVGLADGSVVTLDAGSAVEVTLTGDARRLVLTRGRARFSVAHDGRLFTVAAGGGETIARGTVFDVALAPDGRVGVALWRGVVDVSPSVADGAAVRPPARRLVAGEALGYQGGQLLGTATRPAPAGAAWADGAGEFDNVSLGFVVERANRGAAVPIRLGDLALAALRVSGRFDTRDGDRLAHDLARLFDLRAERGPDAIVLTRP